MPRGIRGAQIADGTIQGVDIEDGSLTFADFDSNEINWKEPVANEAALPTTNNVVGDARVAMAEVTLHLWDGTAWKAFVTSSYTTTSFNTDLATKTTDDVTEGTTNKYFYTHTHVTDSWHAMTLTTGVTNYSATYSPARYRKDAMGYVHLSGMVKCTVSWDGKVITTLPVGYRPDYTLICTGQQDNINASYGGGARIDVKLTGDVVIEDPSTGAWVSMEGITFFVG